MRKRHCIASARVSKLSSTVGPTHPRKIQPVTYKSSRQLQPVKPGESVSQVVQVLVDKAEKEVRLQWKFVPIEPEYSGPEWVPICLRGRIVAADTMTPFGPVRSVNLKGSELADDLLLDVGTLATIEQLDLSYSYVTDAGLEHLKRLKSLQSLNLRGTKVSGVGLEHLNGLNRLRSRTLASSTSRALRD